VGFPEGEPGCGAAVLLAEDLGDGGVVVAGCQAADQVQGVFGGGPAMLAAGGHRHLHLGAGAALPDDLDLARPGGVALAGVVLHGDGDLGDDGADEFFALGVGGGRGLEDGPKVGSGGGDPGGFFLGEGDGPAGLLGGELAFRGADGRELVFQDGLQGPGDEPVLRLDRARSSARSKTARFWRNWASVSDMAWTVAARQAGASAASSSASTVSCSRGPPTRWQVLAPYIWLARPHR
jgi:hypothetical protein